MAPENFADQDGGRRILEKVVRSRCGDEVDPQPLQHVVAGELHGEITSEAVGRLHDDSPDAIAGNPLQHRHEAVALDHRSASLLRNPDNLTLLARLGKSVSLATV
jgi:hypothetical protein